MIVHNDSSIRDDQVDRIITVLERVEYLIDNDTGNTVCVCCGGSGVDRARPNHMNNCILAQVLYEMYKIDLHVRALGKNREHIGALGRLYDHCNETGLYNWMDVAKA